MSDDGWKCVDPILCTYDWGQFRAQRTWLDTVVLWRNGQRIDMFDTLASALDAAKKLAVEPPK